MTSNEAGGADEGRHMPYLIPADGSADVFPRPRHSPDMESIDLRSAPRSGRSSVRSNATATTAPLSPRSARRLRELGPKMTEVTSQLTSATSEAGRVLAAGAKQMTRQGIKTLTQPMEISKFGWFDALTALISVIMFYFDVVSDVLVAFYMRNDPETQDWFLPTVLLIVMPLVVVNGFSLYWYWFDEHVCEPDGMCYRSPKATRQMWAFRVIAHLFLQATILRYLDLIYYGVKSVREGSLVGPHEQGEGPAHHHHHQYNHHNHKHNHHPAAACDQDKGDSGLKEATNGYNSIVGAAVEEAPRPRYRVLWVHAERDAANVDVLSSMVQDAPQLILQLYIMTNTVPAQALQGQISQTLIMQLLSVAASLVAMAWSVASFSKATRLAEASIGNLSPAGLLLLSLAHFCSIAPQVLCFALFSSKYLIEFLVIVSCHWVATSTLVLVQLICCPDPIRLSATFTHDMRKGPCSRVDDIAFSAAFGLILLYTFMDVGGRAPRIQGGVFHAFRLVEEACMLAFWYLATDGDMWYHWLPLVLVSVLCVLGGLFLLAYLACADPDRRSKRLLTI